MTASTQGLLASYEYLDSTVDAIEGLRKAGFKTLKAYAPYPEHHIEAALGYGQSPVRVFTLVGGLTGTATGFAFTTWTSMDWPLVVGGKPIVSIPAYVVIAFELTVLFGALATVIGLFILSKLPDVRPAVIYDPEFSAGRYGVYVEAPAGRADEARRILEKEEPVELREGSEVAHA
ncbi:MAG: DUF3341 domain-containing protein [Gemmatimonadota bacterium]|jgi:hypothetical protein